MKIKKLSITNFLIIGKAEINLDNRGLLLVQGTNDDDSSARSNGAGKSTIIESVSWCLYGETARGEFGDSVVNEIAKKNCNVTLTIEDGGDVYVVSRNRKCSVNKNDLLLYKQIDESLVNVTEGTTKLTQELVNKIVGCSYSVFVAAIYSSQETMLNLPEMTDKQLKLIVEESAGVDRLQSAYELAISSFNDIANSVKKRQADIELKVGYLEDIINEINEATIGAEKHEAMLKGEIEHTLSEINAEKMKRRVLHSKTEIGTYNRSIENELEKKKKEISACLQKDKEKRLEINTLISLLEKNHNKSEANYEVLKNECKRTKSELENVNSMMGKPCSKCGKKHKKEDISDVSENLTDKLVKGLKELKSAKEIAGSASEELKVALLKREELEDESVSIENILMECDELQSLINCGLKEIDEIVKAEAKLKELECKIDKLNKDLECNPYIDILKSKKEKRSSLEIAINRSKEELLTLEQEESDMLLVAEVFSRGGVRAHVLDTVTPFLNEKTAEYLGTLSDGNISAVWSTLSKTSKGELREKFSIDVEKQNGSKSFKGLSGGEKRKVRLSTAMALCDLVASRATKPIEFQFYDEVDHALDEAGLERLMTILEKRGKEKGTVLIISHNSLNDWGADSITVVNKGGVSEVYDVCG